jgi:hypothetical protein
MKSNLISQLPACATGAANSSTVGAANAWLVQLEAQAEIWRVVFPPRVAAGLATNPCVASRASNEPGAREPGAHETCASRRWAGAQAELEQLHVEEFARLLAQASALRAHLGRGGADGAGAVEVGEVGPSSQFESLAWRSALSDQRAAAAADGAQLSPALAALLDVLLETPLDGGRRAPLERWPSARQLALAAASLWPSARTRAALGRIALADGDWRAARGCFESALNFPATERCRGELLTELGSLAAREPGSARSASSRPESSPESRPESRPESSPESRPISSFESASSPPHSHCR